MWQAPTRCRDRAVHSADHRQGHLRQQGTRPCLGAPSGDPEEAGTGAGHEPSHQPTGRKRVLRATPGPWALQVPMWTTHTDGLPWPPPSVAAEGGPRSGAGAAPPEEAEAGTLVPRLPIPADRAHPLPLQGLSPGQAPRLALVGGAGLPLSRGEHLPLKPNSQPAGSALEVGTEALVHRTSASEPLAPRGPGEGHGRPSGGSVLQGWARPGGHHPGQPHTRRDADLAHGDTQTRHPALRTQAQTSHQQPRERDAGTWVRKLPVIVKLLLCRQLLKHFGRKITASEYGGNGPCETQMEEQRRSA